MKSYRLLRISKEQIKQTGSAGNKKVSSAEQGSPYVHLRRANCTRQDIGAVMTFRSPQGVWELSVISSPLWYCRDTGLMI